MSRLDKFQLFAGILGLCADTIAITLFAESLGILGFPWSKVQLTEKAIEGNALLTVLIGFYSLTLIIWFLIRFERSRNHAIGDFARELMDLNEDQFVLLLISFIPVIGAGFLAWIRPTRTIFFFSIFIAFLPATLWIYTFSVQAMPALFLGLLNSMLISQYATFFAIVLDSFFN